jgi:hypothetical protein
VFMVYCQYLWHRTVRDFKQSTYYYVYFFFLHQTVIFCQQQFLRSSVRGYVSNVNESKMRQGQECHVYVCGDLMYMHEFVEVSLIGQL